MTIQQVLYVLEISSRNSVSQAAQRLYLSQSALSQQLRRLEEELGYSLFSRTASGLQLTPEGRNFCEQAAPVAERWTEFCKAVQKYPKPEHLRLRLGLGSRVYSNDLFSKIAAYFESKPEIEVAFLTEAGQDVVDALRRGELDLALDRLPAEEPPQDSGDFFSCPLIRERQCVLLSHKDPRSRHSSLSFRDLQGCTMISGLEDSAEDRSMKSTLRKYHISVNRIYRSDGIETNMRLVRDGMGIALGPASFSEHYNVAAVPLEPETWVSLQFICLNSALKNAEIRHFRDYLLDFCQSEPAPPEQTEKPT